MAIRTFEVTVTGTFRVELPEELLPDDEWRSVFYSIYTLEELAEHFVINRGIRGWRKDQLDGFCGVDLMEQVQVSDEYDWECDTREIVAEPRGPVDEVEDVVYHAKDQNGRK